MAIKGALGATFSISANRPTTRSAANYKAMAAVAYSPTQIGATGNTFTFSAAAYGAILLGDPIKVTAAGSVTGITANTTYYAIKGTSNTVQLATSVANAYAGTEVDIGGSPTGVALQYSHWKQCTEVISVGEYGREYQIVTAQNLGTGATRKAKGGYDSGTFQVEVLFDARDVGQTRLEEAGIASTTPYAFRVGFPGSGSLTGEAFYFEGYVSNLKRVVGGPNDMLMMRATIAIDHRNIIEGTL